MKPTKKQTSLLSENEQRAMRADAAVKTHAKAIGGLDNEVQIQIQDLLTDLLHLSREHCIDLDEVLDHARVHFAAELRGED